MGIFRRQQMDDSFFFHLENWIWHFMQIVSNEDNLHEMSNYVFWKQIRKNIQYVVWWKFYPEC